MSPQACFEHPALFWALGRTRHARKRHSKRQHRRNAMAERIVFKGKGDVSVESFTPNTPTGNKVLFDTEYSLMSTGTENIVLNQDYSPGTAWDAWVSHPFYPGYACVGTIAECGPQVTGLTVGTRAVYRGSHASSHTPDAADLIAIPDGIEPTDAVWFALAKIASMGARVARYRLGDSVCVIGAGPIGQMTVRWAYACGVENIVVCDRAKSRLAIARKGGATAVLERPAAEIKDELIALCDGALPRVVVDTTGHAAVFPTALSLCAARGTLVLLGDTGHPQEQHLTADVVGRGVTIVGAHDTHEEEGWDEPTIARLFFRLVGDGRFKMEGLNTHLFKPGDCTEAYATANKVRDETMGILFDWRGEQQAQEGAEQLRAAS
ncbi:MAG: zinc-binding dehydrogenase [Chitinivibrionales bacterium]|nr:zinc-binding dehydrogenase [Chitinivibrionales bacterium]